jgi:hypothetical protein
MAKSGCLEQFDRGADKPTSHYNYHETHKGGRGPIWAVAPLMMMINFVSFCVKDHRLLM